jgi:hypothetical protein
MGYYDEEETARQYITMADGYEGKLLIDALCPHVPKDASVLEIGMGPGRILSFFVRNIRSRVRTIPSFLSSVTGRNILTRIYWFSMQ